MLYQNQQVPQHKAKTNFLIFCKTNLFDPYLESYDILSVDLQQSVVNQETIPGCRGILCNLCDLAVLEHKADVVCAVFL